MPCRLYLHCWLLEFQLDTLRKKRNQTKELFRLHRLSMFQRRLKNNNLLDKLYNYFVRFRHKYRQDKFHKYPFQLSPQHKGCKKQHLKEIQFLEDKKYNWPHQRHYKYQLHRLYKKQHQHLKRYLLHRVNKKVLRFVHKFLRYTLYSFQYP